jgi:hypothetical protein
MLLTAEQLLARNFAVDLVVAQATGELSGAVPERARIVELDRASEWRAYRGVLTADAGSVGALAGAWLLGRKPSGKLRHLPSLVRHRQRRQLCRVHR